MAMLFPSANKNNSPISIFVYFFFLFLCSMIILPPFFLVESRYPSAFTFDINTFSIIAIHSITSWVGFSISTAQLTYKQV